MAALAATIADWLATPKIDAGLFSRRLDKKNRFVYLVRQTGENAVDVTILSLLGHYKHLDTQLQSAKKQEKGNGA